MMDFYSSATILHRVLTSSGVVIVIDETYLNRHHHGDVLNSAADAGGQPYTPGSKQSNPKQRLIWIRNRLQLLEIAFS